MRKLAIAAAAALITGHAAAQAPQCQPVEEMLDFLKAGYDERPVWRGAAGENTFAILTMAPAGGWTFISVTIDGTACVVAAGQKSDFLGKGV